MRLFALTIALACFACACAAFIGTAAGFIAPAGGAALSIVGLACCGAWLFIADRH